MSLGVHNDMELSVKNTAVEGITLLELFLPYKQIVSEMNNIHIDETYIYIYVYL